MKFRISWFRYVTSIALIFIGYIIFAPIAGYEVEIVPLLIIIATLYWWGFMLELFERLTSPRRRDKHD